MPEPVSLAGLEQSARDLADVLAALHGQIADLRVLCRQLEHGRQALEDDRDHAYRVVGRLRDACRKVLSEYDASKSISSFTVSFLKGVLQ
jgi:hypothetical protein